MAIDTYTHNTGLDFDCDRITQQWPSLKAAALRTIVAT